MQALPQFLSEHSSNGLLPWTAQVAATQRFGLSHADVEDAALQAGLLPSRYQRNRKTISIENQRTLLHSRVVVLGCGGLGGYILEELARLGIGTLVAVDPDVFEEHNVNRQILSTLMTVGSPKVYAAAKRVAEINPSVKLIPIHAPYKPDNARKLFDGANVVIDALDSIPTRLALAESCKELSLPLVHGAIAGWYGQVTTQFPGEGTLTQLYGRAKEVKGVEQSIGNPAFSPAIVASIEVAEVCKVLLHVGEPLRNRVLVIDLLTMTFDEIKMRQDINSANGEHAGVLALCNQQVT
jgi:molybdopterin/thiamine biosynthesis adenylyltransferase